jgi:hypothetical protein
LVWSTVSPIYSSCRRLSSSISDVLFRNVVDAAQDGFSVAAVEKSALSASSPPVATTRHSSKQTPLTDCAPRSAARRRQRQLVVNDSDDPLSSRSTDYDAAS